VKFLGWYCTNFGTWELLYKMDYSIPGIQRSFLCFGIFLFEANPRLQDPPNKLLQMGLKVNNLESLIFAKSRTTQN